MMQVFQQKRLDSVERATKRLQRAQFDQRQAIFKANEAGISMRVIAAKAGVSHEQVRRIIKEFSAS